MRSGEIRRGDLVVMVRSCECSPDDPDLWRVFVVGDMSPEATVCLCTVCNRVEVLDFLVEHPSRPGQLPWHGIPRSFLRKIDPPESALSAFAAGCKSDCKGGAQLPPREREEGRPEVVKEKVS